MLDRLISLFTSLRLTVVCLVFGTLLVFAGTMAQVDMGLYKAQHDFFRTYFVLWKLPGLPLTLPLPGGYLVGGVLLINLVASHFKRFKFSVDKAGIWMVHLGLILLLLGQLATDKLSNESSLHLREGETKNYSESNREVELAVIDITDSSMDKVVALAHQALVQQKTIRLPELPFTVKVQKFYENSSLENRPANSAEPAAATQGVGTRAILKPLPRVTATDRRDIPTVVFELLAGDRSLGTWIASEYINAPQTITHDGRQYQVELRLRRHYKPFSLQLVEFRHDLYPGTEIPKNFSSRLLLNRPDNSEKREVLIKMNNPLRYAGETFYQASFDTDNQGTILQVVHNPSWLTPYLSCILVGVGLIVQFATHLFGFTFKRRTT
jgi:hypothetical protein